MNLGVILFFLFLGLLPFTIVYVKLCWLSDMRFDWEKNSYIGEWKLGKMPLYQFLIIKMIMAKRKNNFQDKQDFCYIKLTNPLSWKINGKRKFLP